MTMTDTLPDDPMQQTSAGADPDEGMAGVAVDDDDALVFDLDAVDERGTYELIPAGIYDATVDNVEYQRSKAGNPMLTWQFAIQHEGRDRRLWHHTVFVENGLPRVKRTLARIAPDMPLNQFRPKDQGTLNALMGRNCRVRVGQRQYEGTMRNEVREVLPALAEAATFLPS
jgi:Protein of unknown function (DUF669)